MADKPKHGDLRVWWIPQLGAPIESFKVDVSSVEEGAKLMDVLADYDRFQFENRIKPDYANMGGLMVFNADVEDSNGDPGGDWIDWEYEDDEFYTDDPHEYLEHMCKHTAV